VISWGVFDSPLAPALVMGTPTGICGARLFRRNWGTTRDGGLFRPLACGARFFAKIRHCCRTGCRLHLRRCRKGGGAENGSDDLIGRAVPDQSGGRRCWRPVGPMSPPIPRFAQTIGARPSRCGAVAQRGANRSVADPCHRACANPRLRRLSLGIAGQAWSCWRYESCPRAECLDKAVGGFAAYAHILRFNGKQRLV